LHEASNLARVIFDLRVEWLFKKLRDVLRLLQTDDTIWLLCQSKSAGIVVYNLALD
jgi:hypothetical protein